jgi:hypothetical protein
MHWRVALLVAMLGCAGPTPVPAPEPGDDPWDPPAECATDPDCVAAAAKCCDCPAFAVPVLDKLHQACVGIRCPLAACSDSTRVACDDGRCVLACVAIACEQSCASGFATDESGCLSCSCAAPVRDGCREAAECVRIRADCCGCAHGGRDTAVLARDAERYEADLRCDPTPQCPAFASASCEADAELACVQGRCELLTSGALPTNACGRPDLPSCPTGQVCVINGNDGPANAHGVGLCQPPAS